MSAIKKIYQAFMHGPIYVIIFGMIFFGIGGGLTYSQYAFRQRAIPAQGEVTGHTMGGCDDDGCSYKSVVSYTTEDGRSESYTTTFSSNPPAYDVGESVTVFYSPDNPGKAVIKGEGKVFRLIFMGIGGAIILSGLAFFASNVKDAFIIED